MQLSTVHHLQSAFDEASSCSRYHPSKGYSWDFKNGKALAAKKETPVREEPSSLFQRQRVDMLLAELTRKFPLPVPKPVHQAAEACMCLTYDCLNCILFFILSIFYISFFFLFSMLP